MRERQFRGIDSTILFRSRQSYVELPMLFLETYMLLLICFLISVSHKRLPCLDTYDNFDLASELVAFLFPNS